MRGRRSRRRKRVSGEYRAASAQLLVGPAHAATMPGVHGSSGPVLRARGPQTVLVKRYVPKIRPLQFGKGGGRCVRAGEGRSCVDFFCRPGPGPAGCTRGCNHMRAGVYATLRPPPYQTRLASN